MNPVATPIFFYALAGVAIASAIAVVTQKNPVHSAISLIITLLSLAGLYMMLYAPFVAGVQIILYVGGIMVLFLFVIMLVNVEVAEKERSANRMWPAAVLCAAALGTLFIYVYMRGRTLLPAMAPPAVEQNNTQQIGTMLYGAYMLPFEIASILLLVAIVGAVVMAKKRI